MLKNSFHLLTQFFMPIRTILNTHCLTVISDSDIVFHCIFSINLWNNYKLLFIAPKLFFFFAALTCISLLLFCLTQSIPKIKYWFLHNEIVGTELCSYISEAWHKKWYKFWPKWIKDNFYVKNYCIFYKINIAVYRYETDTKASISTNVSNVHINDQLRISEFYYIVRDLEKNRPFWFRH